MTQWKWVSRQVIEAVHERQIAEHGGAIGLRDENAQESALARPVNLSLYGEPDAAELAAALAFGLAKNHPFVDGNKRTGFVIGILFLELNGYRFSASEETAAQAVIDLAAGKLNEAQYAAFLRANSKPAKSK